MKLNLNACLAAKYKSSSQKVRVMTESWVGTEAFCPNCGNRIKNFQDNAPVADFFCPKCSEEYELKSKKGGLGSKVVDGAYKTMVERLTCRNNPSFFFLNYSLKSLEVVNFLVIPKHFFVPAIIEKRKPLALTARRAGWVGCNIILRSIPDSGKISYIQNGQTVSKKSVLKKWHKTLFLKEQKRLPAKGWIIDVMNCVERLGKKEFALEDVYSFEEELKAKHPKNQHVKDKIRQQLQYLRDNGYLEFKSRDRYALLG